MYWLRKLKEDLRIWPFENFVIFWVVVAVLAPFARMGWQAVTGLPVVFSAASLMTPVLLLLYAYKFVASDRRRPSLPMTLLRSSAITVGAVVLIVATNR